MKNITIIEILFAAIFCLGVTIASTAPIFASEDKPRPSDGQTAIAAAGDSDRGIDLWESVDPVQPAGDQQGAVKNQPTVTLKPIKLGIPEPNAAKEMENKSPPPASKSSDSPWSSPESKKDHRPGGFSAVPDYFKQQLNLDSFSGNVTVLRHRLDVDRKIVNRPVNFSYSLGKQMKMGDKNLSVNFSQNQQDQTVRQSSALNTAINFTSKKLSFNIVNSSNDQADVTPSRPAATNNNGNTQINMNINAIKKLPLAVSFNKQNSSSQSGDSAAQENSATSYRITTSTNIFRKLTADIGYGGNISENVSQQDRMENNAFDLKLNCPLTNRLSIGASFNSASIVSSPLVVTQGSQMDTRRRALSLSYKVTPSLSLTTFLNSNNDSATNASGSANNRTDELTHGLVYTRGIFNVQFGQKAVDTSKNADTLDDNVTMTMSPKSKRIKPISFSFFNKDTMDTNGVVTGQNRAINTSNSIVFSKRLSFTTTTSTNLNDSYSQNSQETSSTNRNINHVMNHNLSKSVTQSLSLSKNTSTATASDGSASDSWTYSLQKAMKIVLHGKDLATNLGYKYILTTITPSSQKNFNDLYELKLGFKPSKLLDLSYALTFNNNRTRGIGAAENLTRQNQFGLGFKSAGGSEAKLMMNFCNSRDGSYARSIVLNANRPITKKLSYVLSLMHDRSSGQSRKINFNTGLSLNF